MAEPNIGELLSMTLKRRTSGKTTIADNVSNHIPLLMMLKKKGLTNVYDGPGGHNISIVLDYAEAGFQRFSGFDTLTVNETQVFDSAEYTPVQAAVPIAISGRQMLMNQGKSAAKRLVKSKQKNAERTMMNNIATDVASDGSAANQIGGLDLIVDKTPTGSTVGGILTTGQTWWENQVTDVSTDVGTYDSDNVRRAWSVMAIKLARGGDRPDVVISGDGMFEEFQSGLQTLQRYTDTTSAGFGFNTLKFQGMDVFHDSTITTNDAYMLNLDYFEFVAYPGANFEPGERKEPSNQDAFVQHLLYMGNLTCSNRALQGVIKE